MKRGLGRNGKQLTKSERSCIERAFVVDYDKKLGEKVLRAGSVRKLDDVAQGRVFGLVQRCAPIKLGKAVLASFPPLAGTSSKPDERLLSCIGGRVQAAGAGSVTLFPPVSVGFNPGVPAPFSFWAEPYSRTPNELQTLTFALFNCASDYLINGPFAHGLGLTNAVSKCVADEARHYPVVIAELSSVLFGRLGQQRSEPLNRLIEICTRDPRAFF